MLGDVFTDESLALIFLSDPYLLVSLSHAIQCEVPLSPSPRLVTASPIGVRSRSLRGDEGDAAL